MPLGIVVQALEDFGSPTWWWGRSPGTSTAYVRPTEDAEFVLSSSTRHTMGRIAVRIGPDCDISFRRCHSRRPRGRLGTRLTSSGRCSRLSYSILATTNMIRAIPPSTDGGMLTCREAWLPTVEDVIVTKLPLGRIVPGALKDRNDVQNVIAVQGNTDRLGRTSTPGADRHGTRALLDDIRAPSAGNRLGSPAHHVVAAVDVQDLPGHRRRQRAAQEHRRVGHLLRLDRPRQRRAHRRVLDRLLELAGPDAPRRPRWRTARPRSGSRGCSSARGCWASCLASICSAALAVHMPPP